MVEYGTHFAEVLFAERGLVFAHECVKLYCRRAGFVLLAEDRMHEALVFVVQGIWVDWSSWTSL